MADRCLHSLSKNLLKHPLQGCFHCCALWGELLSIGWSKLGRSQKFQGMAVGGEGEEAELDLLVFSSCLPVPKGRRPPLRSSCTARPVCWLS